jgi:protocatechuate 4,5-dioxygenase alpha chain
MSRNVVERVLYQLCVDRSSKQRFKEAAEEFLDRFALSAHEREMILGFDVKGLQKHGINPMLTMGYWQELAPQRDTRAYMKKLRGMDGDAPVFSASLKG